MGFINNAMWLLMCGSLSTWGMMIVWLAVRAIEQWKV